MSASRAHANAEVIRELRIRSGIGHAEFCQRAGIAQSTLWRIEHGAHKYPHVGTLGKIARTLGVQVPTIIHRVEEAA